MPESENETQEGRMVNVRLRGELLDQFNKLCETEMRDQSSMIRWLIATEYARRANNQIGLFDQATVAK